MMPTLYYFLQVTVCSAVLYAYYLLALRNKRFHHYNRFYLLMILLVSWIVPLIKIPVKAIPVANASPGNTLRFFEVIADNNTNLEEYVSNSTPVLDTNLILGYAYWLVSLVLAFVFLRGIIRLLILLKKCPAYRIGNALIVDTTAKGAPFTFFRFIFWDREIDINSNVGKQVLAHEMVHVNEKHTIDKIVTAIVVCIGWFNPVFWLTKKELDMVHEFIADKKAANNDASELASMLLAVSYPNANFCLTNSFFHSPIKRRITMITKFHLTRFPYLRRILILPLIGIVVMLFAFRKQVANIVGVDPVNRINKEQQQPASTQQANAPGISTEGKTNVPVVHNELSRVYTIVIDPGHGGQDKGAMAADGTTEASIALEISKMIERLNQNAKLNIILTREEDVYMSPVTKSEFTVNNKADLFISVHVNTAMEAGVITENGIEVVLPKFDTAGNYKQSYLFANTIGTHMQKVNPKTTLKSRQTGIWVLMHAKCPAALIECGYLSDKKDLENLKSATYRQKLARQILEAAEHYLHYAEEKK